MNAAEFATRYGPTALVTGAAHGIGRAFAHSLAARGLALLLVDIDEEGLERTASAILGQYGVGVEILTADLTCTEALERVAAAGLRSNIGLLVNNAGIGVTDAFLNTKIEDHLNILYLNTRAPLFLTHKLVPAMQERGHGGVIFTSSIAALIGAPGVGNYAATKSYILSLAEALYGELLSTGVDALAVLPGLTRTRGVTASLTAEQAQALVAMEPEQVTESALKALGRGPSVVPGIRPWLASLALRIMPRKPFLRYRGKVQYQVK